MFTNVFGLISWKSPEVRMSKYRPYEALATVFPSDVSFTATPARGAAFFQRKGVSSSGYTVRATQPGDSAPPV